MRTGEDTGLNSGLVTAFTQLGELYKGRQAPTRPAPPACLLACAVPCRAVLLLRLLVPVLCS